MPDSRATIAFPADLSNEPVDALSVAPSPDRLKQLQIQLALEMYARADQDRVEGRDDAVPAQFLRVILNLIDVMELNGIDDAARCVTELNRIIELIYVNVPTPTAGNHN